MKIYGGGALSSKSRVRIIFRNSMCREIIRIFMYIAQIITFTVTVSGCKSDWSEIEKGQEVYERYSQFKVLALEAMKKNGIHPKAEITIASDRNSETVPFDQFLACRAIGWELLNKSMVDFSKPPLRISAPKDVHGNDVFLSNYYASRSYTRGSLYENETILYQVEFKKTGEENFILSGGTILQSEVSSWRMERLYGDRGTHARLEFDNRYFPISSGSTFRGDEMATYIGLLRHYTWPCRKSFQDRYKMLMEYAGKSTNEINSRYFFVNIAEARDAVLLKAMNF